MDSFERQFGLEPEQTQPKREFVERRRKKDWVTKAVPIFAVVGWLFAFVALFFLDSASPETSTIFSRLFDSPVRSYWNTSLLLVVLGILLLVFIVCLVGFFFNMSRSRRKSDKYNKPLIVLGGLSVISIVAFLIRFAGSI